jgi:hypothetical protein
MSETTTKDEAIRTSHHAPKAPGPSIPSLMKSLPTMRNNLPGFMISLTQHYGDVVRISILNQKGFLLNHPDSVRQTRTPEP